MLDELSKKKTEFESKTLPVRLEMIATAVRTYQEYIDHIQESMKMIESHFQGIAKNNQERANWQVNPPKTETVSTNGSYFSGWFSGSSTPVETKKTTVEKKD